MTAVPNPALEKLVAHIGDEMLVGQVLIRHKPPGFELCHGSDRATEASSLRSFTISELRSLAQSTAAGAFRPLKAAPTLISGWITTVDTPAQLELALSQLYPGFIADWFAAQSPAPPITHYREYTGRQTGMYRITTMLTDEQAARMTGACCHPRFCLKQRLWTVPGLEPDRADAKSIIPCLEPCAVLLEFARKAARLEQEEKVAVTLTPSELETLRASLEQVLATPANREADFNSPANSRRAQLLLDRLKHDLPPT